MTKKAKGVRKLRFELKGSVGYWDNGGNDPDTWHGAKLDETFETNSIKEAIEVSKRRVEVFLEKNKEYVPDPLDTSPKEDWEPWVKRYNFTLTQIVWSMKYRLPKAGKAAVPAVHAVDGGVEEALYI